MPLKNISLPNFRLPKPITKTTTGRRENMAQRLRSFVHREFPFKPTLMNLKADDDDQVYRRQEYQHHR